MRKGGQGKGAKGGVAVEERSGEAAGGKVIKSVREVHGSTERTGVEVRERVVSTARAGGV